MAGDVGADTSEDVSEGNVSEGNVSEGHGGGREEARIKERIKERMKAADVHGESALVTGAASLEEMGGLSVCLTRCVCMHGCVYAVCVVYACSICSYSHSRPPLTLHQHLKQPQTPIQSTHPQV